MYVCVCVQPNGNNRRQVGHPNGIIVVPWRGTKASGRRCIPERGVSTWRITKHLETVPKGAGPILYERHGWPINARITKLTTSGHRALSCPLPSNSPSNPFGLMLLTREFPVRGIVLLVRDTSSSLVSCAFN